MIVEFISSKIKIGFQIKSYGDVKNKNFHKNVNAQIAESQRYNLQKLIIVIVGNLNDERIQGQKIRGLIAELEQRTDQYIHIIPPEKALPIYWAHKANRHPLSLVMLNLADAFKITDGLSQSLSNVNRRVNISVSIKYPNIPKQGKTMQFTLKLNPNELDVLDRMENLNITGEEFRFSKESISKFNVDGKDQLKKGFQYLEVLPNEEYEKLILNILDEKEVIIMELDELTFGKRVVGDTVHVTLRDRRQKSLKIKLQIREKTIEYIFSINYHDVDLSQIRQAIEFLNALDEGEWLQLLVPNHDVDIKIALPKTRPLANLDEILIQLVDALLVIEERSGVKFKIPKELSHEEIERIIKIGKLISDEVFPLTLHGIGLNKTEASSFVKLFSNTISDGEFTITTTLSVLDKEIPVAISCLVTDYRLAESIQDNLHEIAKIDNELITIKLKPRNENSQARLVIWNKE